MAGTNALFNNTGAWIGDGNADATIDVSGNEIIISNSKRGTPFTARMNIPIMEDYFFAVKICELKGSFSVGAIKAEECLPGWRAKGMFYNGNLTNGSAALKTSWGPRYGKGDVVGVRVTKTDSNKLEVTMYQNGQCLGTGFRLEDTSALYQPSIHVDGEATLILMVPEALPSTAVPKEEESSGVPGEWKLLTAKDGQAELAVPATKSIIMTISKEGTSIMRVSMKVGNVLNRSATIEEESSAQVKVAFGPCMSTRMLPPPMLRALESFLTEAKPTTIKAESDTLTMTGDDGKESVWQRYHQVREALSKY